MSIHDDREVVPPWGINGGLYGGTSSKWLIKAGSDKPERIPSKIDNLEVKAGDRSCSRQRDPAAGAIRLTATPEKVARDVRYDLVSAEEARATTASC